MNRHRLFLGLYVSSLMTIVIAAFGCHCDPPPVGPGASTSSSISSSSGGGTAPECIPVAAPKTACSTSSDCYREGDLCDIYACAEGQCVYEARAAAPDAGPGAVVTCDPGHPGDTRWSCQRPAPALPGGQCCTGAPPPASPFPSPR